MTIALLTQCKMITAGHPIREDFVKCSSRNISKGDAISAFETALAPYGLCADLGKTFEFHGYAGHTLVDVRDEVGAIVGYALISWYMMSSSGRYEVFGCLA